MTALQKEREDVVFTLARNLARVSYEDIPAEVREVTKKSILDTLGVAVAASGLTPEVKELAELIKEAGGKKESTILGFGGKAPAWMAALVNGALVHCLDYDDFYTEGRGHPGTATVPSGLAVAERLGRIRGKEFITAVALGNDLFCRLHLAIVASSFGLWHGTPLMGVFAAAATSGKLLGLNEGKMVDALGLAFCQAAGTRALGWEVGSGIRGMYSAFPNQGGVLAALMAQRGIAGIKNSLEGRAGLFNAYFGGKYDRESLTADLGTRFEGGAVGFKPWPCCGAAHTHIDATLALIAQHDIKPQDVEEVIVFVDDFGRNLSQPLEARRKPATPSDAKYSIPFTIAVAIAKRRVIIEDYAPAALKDPEVLGLAQKITPKYDPALRRETDMAPGKVEIRTKEGKAYSKQVDIAYGHRTRPMSWEDLASKFRDCLSHSASPITREKVDKAVELTRKLEELDDVSEVVRSVA